MYLMDIFFTAIKWLIAACIAIKILAKLTMGICRSNTCLVGKTVIVTGGNAGLGYQTALTLAGRGARTIIADIMDSTESVNKIIKATGNPNVIGKFLDLSSLQSIRKFAKEIMYEEDRLDILINNAGLLGGPNSYTKDGLQIQAQVNHFGPFLLTHLLVDLLKKSAPSRIIFVSSIMAFFANLSVENINANSGWSIKTIDDLITYGNTKLLNLITSNVLAEKLKGTGVTSNAVHPGIVVTAIYDTLLSSKAKDLYRFFANRIFLKLVGKDTFEGIQTQIHCALSNKLVDTTGQYFVACLPFCQPKKARNREFCYDIWRRSEELVKLNYDERI